MAKNKIKFEHVKQMSTCEGECDACGAKIMRYESYYRLSYKNFAIKSCKKCESNRKGDTCLAKVVNGMSLKKADGASVKE